MSRTFDEILEEYTHRLDARGSFINYMHQAQQHVNGDVTIPLPELNRNEKPFTANLIAHGLEHMAQRVASVYPHHVFPALVMGKDKDRGSEEWANKRKMATLGWQQRSRMNLKNRRLARWIIGYGTGGLEIRPNFDDEIPEYHLREPLATLPSIHPVYEDRDPDDVIYSYRQTAQWLRQMYPDAYRQLFPRGTRDTTVLTILEYNDADDYVLGVLNTGDKAYSAGHDLWVPETPQDGSRGGIEIRRFPNRTGICNSVVGNRITFDRLMGAYHQLYGIYYNQSELMALENIAIRKGIFPDIAITSTTPGRTPSLVNGTWKDGRTGEVNIVKDGKVDVVQLNPGFLTQPTIDRQERNMRVMGNIPAQWGGETPSNISTGRLGGQILSATADFPIQEYQEVLSDLFHGANVRAMEVAKAYFGDRKKSFHVAFAKVQGNVDYTPNTHFETTEHIVTYAAPGADVNALVIGGGQRIGIGGMSVETWIEQDPMIPDPDLEKKRLLSQEFRNGAVAFIQQQVASGALDPLDVLALAEEVERGATLADAWRKAQERAQQRQAEAAAQQQQAEPLAPEGQPGLSPPGGPPASIEGPNPSMENLSQLLGTLRQPRMQTSPMAAQNTPNVPVG